MSLLNKELEIVKKPQTIWLITIESEKEGASDEIVQKLRNNLCLSWTTISEQFHRCRFFSACYRVQDFKTGENYPLLSSRLECEITNRRQRLSSNPIFDGVDCFKFTRSSMRISAKGQRWIEYSIRHPSVINQFILGFASSFFCA